jgi:hypothetical protein
LLDGTSKPIIYRARRTRHSMPSTGIVTLKDPNSKNARLYATTDLQSYRMVVTAEPYFSVSQPSDVVVMENFLRNNTSGTLEIVDAKYELLKRGQYTMNVNAGTLAPVTSDSRFRFSCAKLVTRSRSPERRELIVTPPT